MTIEEVAVELTHLRAELAESRAREEKLRQAGDWLAAFVRDWSNSGFFDPPTRAVMRKQYKVWDTLVRQR